MDCQVGGGSTSTQDLRKNSQFYAMKSLEILDFPNLFTKEVVEDPFTEGPVHFHEVSQTIKVLLVWDPVRLPCTFHLLTGIVQPEEGALLERQTVQATQQKAICSRDVSSLFGPIPAFHNTRGYPAQHLQHTQECQIQICDLSCYMSARTKVFFCLYLCSVVHHEVSAAHSVWAVAWRDPEVVTAAAAHGEETERGPPVVWQIETHTRVHQYCCSINGKDNSTKSRTISARKLLTAMNMYIRRLYHYIVY